VATLVQEKLTTKPHGSIKIWKYSVRMPCDLYYIFKATLNSQSESRTQGKGH